MDNNFKPSNIFNSVLYEKFPRHNFDTSYLNQYTMNHGYAIPFFCDSVMPGDRIDLRSFGKVQLQPLATNTFQRLTFSMRFFYVPYRLICPDWDKMISQDGFDAVSLPPYTVLTGDQLNVYLSKPSGLLDYLNVNIWNVNDDLSFKLFRPGAKLAFNIFEHYAYYLIWDTYYRDENLMDSIIDLLPEMQLGYNDSQPLFHYLHRLLPIAYEKDYFTTALPWRQKGQPVQLSQYLSPGSLSFSTPSFSTGFDILSGPVVAARNANLKVSDSVSPAYSYSPIDSYLTQGTNYDVPLEPNNVIKAYIPSMSSSVDIPADTLSVSFDINELRYANALQRYLERLALGGNRPSEFYLSMYGVQIDDLRIGQPLYLGGGKTDILITEVRQTAYYDTLEGNPSALGSLAGDGKVFPNIGLNHPYVCDEPGVVMGICSIRPEINYSQGLPRDKQLFSHFDYPNPLFAQLGEQPVMQSELYIKPDINNDPRDIPNNNDDIFGYQSPYAYKKFKRNEVHGEFRTSLNHWLLGLHFDNAPFLNSDFITVDQDYSIFAVTDPDVHHYMCEIFNDYEVERSLPDFVIPKI